MKFVETADLKTGMRLARPIYNKKSVLLFERDSRLTPLAIESVKNFGLLGVYILEPAEPLPPMSEEDLEFERFQIATVFSIQDELEKILETGHKSRLDRIVATILKNYGHLENKISFYQNLRGQDDFICRHSLNTAIFCAMITHAMNVMVDEQLQTVQAAVLHDIGKLRIPKEELFDRNGEEQQRKDRVYREQLAGLDVLENLSVDGLNLKRICSQALRAQQEFDAAGDLQSKMKLSLKAKILLVANRYDEITAVDLQGRAESEVRALKEFYDNPDVYDREVVDALVRCVNILFPGVSVELNTGEKALVVGENPGDILRPRVLTFGDNSILDLAAPENREIYVVDVMKTLDNRYIMNRMPGEQEDGA